MRQDAPAPGSRVGHESEPRPSGLGSQPQVAAAAVAVGRFPDDRRLDQLIKTLTAGNARFEELWNSGTVGAHREDHKIADHPLVGPIAVHCDVMIDGDAERKIVMLTAAPGSEDENKLRLGLVTGVATLGSPSDRRSRDRSTTR